MADRPTGTVTFLFTDIEGSAPLWERDAAAMQTSLARHNAVLQNAIQSHGGQVFKIVGDAFQAAFANAPDAVAAALDAQRALRESEVTSPLPIRVRMGLHVGPAETRDDDYLPSHTLNRVSRIISAGHGGQMLLSLAVAELVREHLPHGATLRDLGEHRVKGLAKPEHLFQLTAPDLPSDFEPLKTLPRELSPLDRIVHNQFIGRSRELSYAVAQLNRAINGEGQVLLVSGEPGIGKTRLVRELILQAREMGAQVFLGECYAEGSAPYAPIAQILRDAPPPPSATGEGWGGGVLPDLLALGPDLRARFPNIAPNPPLDDPQAEQQRVFESFVAFCDEVSKRAPLVLFVDDAHWADSGTLFLLRHLARRTKRSRLLMVMTYREVELDEARALNEVLIDLNRERLATRLKLTRLSREQTRDFLAAMFAEEITPEFLDGIYHETEGNPFFIEEVCKALIEEGKLYYEAGRWHRPPMNEMNIPQSVRVTIQTRVGKLPEQTQDVLRLAAILGREFDFETLRKASELDEDALLLALETAEHAQLIGEVHHTEPIVYSFAHALIPATLSESVSGLRRQRMHRCAATAMEAVHPDDFEILAHHYEHAGDQKRAGEHYEKAGDRALAVYAYAEAEKNYRAASELGGSDAENARVLSKLGQAMRYQGRYNEAIEVWREAIKLHRRSGGGEQVAELYARAARAAWEGNDLPRGLALAQEGLAAVGSQPETPAMARLLHETARAYFFNALLDKVRPLAERALEIASRVGDIETQAEILITLGFASRVEPRFDQAIEMLKRAIQLAESAGLIITAARGHNNLGVILRDSLGDLSAARDHFQQAMDLARQARVVVAEIFYLHHVARTSLLMGDFATAEKKISTMGHLLNAAPQSSLVTALGRYVESIWLRYRGDLDQALQVLGIQQKELRQRGNLQALCAVDNTLGEILIELGRWDEPEDSLREAIQFGDQGQGQSFCSRCMLAIALAHRGGMEEAHQLLAEAEARAKGQPTPLEQASLSEAKARLAAMDQRWTDALALFHVTAALQARMGMRWYRAQTLREWADACLARKESGDRERAKELLGEALREFEEMKVIQYAEMVKVKLASVEGK